MDRRKFLMGITLTPVVLFIGMKSIAFNRHLPLTTLLSELRRLPAAKLHSTGIWNVSEIFQHCAQSIRYSRLGYPQHYSALFQYTVGATALSAFTVSGSMTHPLDEVIPGAPVLVPELPNDIALTELIYELEQFIAWQGELAPHFAYGSLTKTQYYNAHYLHLQNHLSEISLGAVGLW